MAGVAESCSHVAALLFKIEAAVRICGSKTCTDEAAYWMITRGQRKVEPAPVHAIDYSTAAAKKSGLDKNRSGVPGLRTRAGSSCPKGDDPIHTDMSVLYEAMHACRSVYNVSSEQFYQHYADPIEPSVVPKSLLCLHDNGKDGCELSVLVQHCEGLSHMVAVSEAQAATLEKKNKTAIQIKQLVCSASRTDHRLKNPCCCVHQCYQASPLNYQSCVLPTYYKIG